MENYILRAAFDDSSLGVLHGPNCRTRSLILSNLKDVLKLQGLLDLEPSLWPSSAVG